MSSIPVIDLSSNDTEQQEATEPSVEKEATQTSEVKESEVETESAVQQPEPEATEEVADEDESESEVENVEEDVDQEDDTAPTQEAEEEASEESETEDYPLAPPSVFEASLPAQDIESFLEGATPLVDECRLQATPEGINIKATDPANVAAVDLILSSKAFNSFVSETGTLGVDLERLSKVIGMAESSSDIVTLRLDYETRMLSVEIDNMEFTLALIDPQSIRGGASTPDVDLPSRVVLEKGVLRSGIKAADMVSNVCTFETDSKEEALYITADGDVDDVSLEIPSSDMVDSTLADASSMYALEYLKKISSGIKNSEEVSIRFADGFPAEFSANIADGDGELVYLLAPRVEPEG